jgi:hypothetical protein
VVVVGKHLWRFTCDLTRYTLRTGRWWFPLAIVILAVGAAVAAVVKAAVPTAVYVLF